MEYYYIFYTNENDNIYERTCGCKWRADERIKELKEIYEDAKYFVNTIPKDYKWLY